MKQPLRIRTAIVLNATDEIPLESARLAVFNALLARRYRQPLLLRIDNAMESEPDDEIALLLDDLRWLGLDWEEGPDVGGEYEPYVRSGRSAIYAAFYVKLIELGRAYPCFCNWRELETMRQAQLDSGIPPHYAGGCNRLNRLGRQRKIDQGLPAALRFEVGGMLSGDVEDLLLGQYHCRLDEVGDFIIRSHNGISRRVFTTTVDDALMRITHRFRGWDELQKLPRQRALAETLGLPLPAYGHLPRLLPDPDAPDGRLPTLGELRCRGYRPEAVLNHLARLGHRYDSDRLLDVDELARRFRISRMTQEPVFHRQAQLDRWQRMAA